MERIAIVMILVTFHFLLAPPLLNSGSPLQWRMMQSQYLNR